MAKLKLLKGRTPQSDFDLEKPVMVLGRSSSCDIRLAREWVSARHAQINKRENRHFITDLGSKNLTLLNGKKLEANVEYPLKQNDLIKICDHLLLYLEASTDSWAIDSSRATARMPLKLSPVESDIGSSGSSIFSTIDSSSGSWEGRSSLNPEGKLRAMMRITRSLHDAVSMEGMLAKVLDSLLGIFAQAKCGVVAVTEDGDKAPRVATVRHRNPKSTAEPHINQSLIAHVFASQTGAVADEDGCSLMCVPLVSVSGSSLGVIQVESGSQDDRFSNQDLDLLAHVALQSSFAIETVRLHEHVRRDQELQAEMSTAYRIQLSLLPTERPKFTGYSFDDFYNPARKVGGDYYDYVQLRDGRLAILIGDVAGKGVPAALVVASVTTLLKVMLAGDESPLEVLNQLNSEFEDRFGEQLYLTMLIATLDPNSGRLEIINAGHLPPLLKTQSGPTKLVEPRASGLALGLQPELPYRQLELTIKPGDSLVFYTDGVTEAKNADGEMYRLARLRETVDRIEGRADKLCEGILADVWKHAGNETQTDDICLLCVSRDGD